VGATHLLDAGEQSGARPVTRSSGVGHCRNDGPVRVIEGFFKSVHGFPVTFECLGQTFKSSINAHPVEITMPTIAEAGEHPSGYSGPLIGPPPWKHLPEHHDWSRVFSSEREDPLVAWGGVGVFSNADPIAGPGVAWMHRMRLAFEADGSDWDIAENVGVPIQRGLKAWWECIEAWASAAVGWPLWPISRQIVRHEAQVWGPGEDGTVRMWPETRPGIAIGANTATRGFNPQQVQRLLTIAGDSTGPLMPPVEWELINDARAAIEVGHHRRAVIEAGTAAELALTGLIQQVLSEVQPPGVPKALLDRYKTLGSLAELYGRLGRELPKDFHRAVVNPRNDATHDGYKPTENQARDAVIASAEIVRRLLPLTDLLPVNHGLQRQELGSMQFSGGYVDIVPSPIDPDEATVIE
jgi:hypothetical protein